jgi:cyclic pyranopterin phosphate synthase
MEMTHFNDEGRARMVDVSAKDDTRRTAVAAGSVLMARETLEKIAAGDMKKGDVLGVAQTAGIMGAKKTWDLVPMCHNIPITGADIRFELDRKASRILIEAEVSTTGKTGIEMEALTAVATAALTIYDMAKAIDRGMEIQDIRLIRKEGGKSGLWVRDEEMR